MKVKNWKRALRQAFVYQLCADESYVALHHSYLKNADQEQFVKLGVGLITIGDYAKVEIMARPSTHLSIGYSTAVKREIAGRLGGQALETLNSSQIAERSLKFFLWYVATDKRYYNDFPQAADGFLVNAHILEHNASAFAALFATQQKPFFVIPETHVFQLADSSYFLDSKGGIRTSWEKLALAYTGPVFAAIAEGRNLVVDDFLSPGGSFQQPLYELTKTVVDFQKVRISYALGGLSRLIDENPAKPIARYLVAPYFMFSSTIDPWYKISLEMVKSSIAMKAGHSLYALLCLSNSLLLDENSLQKIVSDYSLPGLDGFLLWVRDFSEETVPVPFAIGFRKLVEGLRRQGKEVVNMYGGPLSIFLRHFGLTGFAAGVCYKESADPTEFPTGGPPGGPVPRFYIPELMIKLPKTEASLALQSLPSLRCNCSICSAQYTEMFDPSTPDPLSRELMNRHFLHVRTQELNTANSNNITSDLSRLNALYTKYSSSHLIVPVEHLPRWASSLA
jgi:hypothetical protein